MSQKNNKTPWYINGLTFKCKQCANCCSGPEEGYIWLSNHEINLLADFLKISTQQTLEKYIKTVGPRKTIFENQQTKDCIFLKKIEGKKICSIYPVRPNQCRTWPFWTSNLKNPTTWNQMTDDCQGINRGKHYSFEEIEKIRKSKSWWNNDS